MNADGSLISNYQMNFSTSGYLCSCGIWVSHGETHVCGRFIQPYIYPLYEPKTYTNIESGRLAELMEAERKLNEIKRIMGDAFG